VRLLERDEQLEAAGRPAPKLSKSKKAASKAAASAALQILLPAPENPQVALLGKLGKATTETSLRVDRRQRSTLLRQTIQPSPS
jgi:hypothetical protein